MYVYRHIQLGVWTRMFRVYNEAKSPTAHVKDIITKSPKEPYNNSTRKRHHHTEPQRAL